MSSKLIFSVAIVLACAIAVNAQCAGGDCRSCSAVDGCMWCIGKKKCMAKKSLEGVGCILNPRADEPLKCPVEQPTEPWNYKDDFARHIMYPLSVAAYSDDPEKCLKKKFSDVQVEFKLTKECHDIPNQNCSGYVAVSPSNNAIIVAFRGSQGHVQAAAQVIKLIIDKQFIELENAGKVNPYFLASFYEIWDKGMKEKLEGLIRANPDSEVWVTGFDLGGAMASIAATVILRDNMAPQDKVKLMTFGQPRTGDRDYARRHNELSAYSYRVVHNSDIVPHSPPRTGLNYFHHRHEIWYNNDMKAPKFVYCQTEMNTCSNAKMFKRSYKEHFNYFGQDIWKYLTELCS